MLKLVWSLGTAVIFILAPFGVFISATSSLNTASLVQFTPKWPIYIAAAYYLCVVLSAIKLLLEDAVNKGLRMPGLIYAIGGAAVLLLGKGATLIPGSTIAWSIFAGIPLAVLLTISLFKKNTVHFNEMMGRSAVLFVAALLCVVVALFLAEPLTGFITDNFPIKSSEAAAAVIAIFSAAIGISCSLINRLLDTLFSGNKQRSNLLNSFSNIAARSLSMDEIMEELVSIISSEISVQKVFICLPENGSYVPRHSSGVLKNHSFTIAPDSPCIKYLSECSPHIVVSEFIRTPYYLSMWETEKELLQTLNLTNIVALKSQNEITGIILLSSKEAGGFNSGQVEFLNSLSSIASIAVKNAALYERVFREARIDSLTNVYNYKYFSERITAEFQACKDDSIALMFVDLDDFKLYNQLYGSTDGDYVLKEVANILRRYAGEGCTIYRYSGKVFALLLPHFDGREATALANEIQQQISLINSTPERCGKKTITVSCGICVSPFSASTARELVENADLAVYNAKTTGKSKIVLFKGTTPSKQSISDRAMDIVERIKGRSDSTYRTHSPTIFALTAAIDAKDHYTYNHSLNVARYSSILATAAGLSEEQVGIIYEAALLHDIGKISIPETILSKTSSLTIDEFALMRNHVNNSIDIIRHLPSMDYLIPAVVGHHERWDGKGYPRGISGEEIPITARCLAIADSFDAMTTSRPYRGAMSTDYAAHQIEENAGTQFDPLLAHVFVNLIRQGEILPYQTSFPDGETAAVAEN
jgi:diguanylate cyclase (GGDEF)-like protein/putative nucleotidyltransferase with HDIG domain